MFAGPVACLEHADTRKPLDASLYFDVFNTIYMRTISWTRNFYTKNVQIHVTKIDPAK